jgi:hypothetical protein
LLFLTCLFLILLHIFSIVFNTGLLLLVAREDFIWGVERNMKKIFGIFICMLMIGTCFVMNLNTVSAEDLVDGNYKYTVSNGEATITDYTGTGGAITIPSTLGGYPTVHIGDNSFVEGDTWHFDQSKSITSVVIPSSVTTIGNYSFSACYKLKSVTIPNSVTTIGEGAFANTALTSLIIPDSVISLGIRMFYNSNYISSVTIGSGITTIPGNAFDKCNALTSIIIPNSVTTISYGAFIDCWGLTYVTIGSGVTTIQNGVFNLCSHLTSITFLGLVAPTTLDSNWMGNVPDEIRGHAYSNSNFPAPGSDFHGLTMGEYISEENELPTAGFSWTPSSPTVNQQVTFDASASSDPDGSIIKYEWDWNNDGTYDDSKTTPTVTHSWSQAGNYPVKLQVTDNGGLKSTKTITVPVSSTGGNGDTDNKGTPGFELIIVICAIAMLLLLRRKRK